MASVYSSLEKITLSAVNICGGTLSNINPAFLYDCVRPNSTTTTYGFFRTRVGEPVEGNPDVRKTFTHTNLETAGRLPKGEYFDIYGCFMYIYPRISIDTTDETPNFNYLTSILDSYIEIRYGDNTFREIPTYLLINVNVNSNLGAGGDTPFGFSLMNLSFPFANLPKGFFAFSEVKRIEEDISFSVTLNLASPLADDESPYYVYFVFIGNYKKGIV
jgi:hypothetical protein